MAEGLLIGDQVHPLITLPGEIPVPVLGTADHGISFEPGDGHNRRRTEDIRAVVWHWTGGEAEPVRMAGVLKARGYGVEFSIAPLGAIYQFADPIHVDTADVGGFNAPSVGVEVVNYGYRAKRADVPSAGLERALYVAEIHGRKLTCARFHPAQLTAALQLARTLNVALDLPATVETSGRVLSRRALREFRGHLGHCNVSGRKLDPGGDLLAHLAANLG